MKEVMTLTGTLALLGTFLFIGCTSANDNGDYNVGVGIADITGPSAEIGMMGYASLTQSAEGIHTRLFSRAFVFQSGNGKPVVFVSADMGMVDQGIKFKVVEKLQEKYDKETFTAQNVLLSATHTHSGPGAYLTYLMYSVTSLGFYEPSFNAIVDGMVQSIERAYANLQPGKLFINRGMVEDANINRSPTSYEANPKAERDEYEDKGGNVDKEMVLVRIEGESGKKLGTINWFAVHPTSMNNTNRLISGDNKGYASMLFEYEMNENDRPGKGEFVAAFASSNLGDVSPNTNGPKCVNTWPWTDCDAYTSTCSNGFVQSCMAFGPGKNMEESTEKIGKKQFDVAKALFEDKNADQLKGDVNYIHQYVDMTNYPVEVLSLWGNKTMETKHTCPGALGYSFAAGTTDGPGMFNFRQGDDYDVSRPFWEMIRDLIFRGGPSLDLRICHGSKPILLPVGEVHKPYEWIPSIVETQILQVGNLYIIGIPGELTTMAGRRLRKKIEEVAKANGKDIHVVIAGLSNVYTHYITTFEEYQKQRYEAASTLYGPHTLAAYLKQYEMLADSLFKGTPVDAGTPPPPLLEAAKQFSLIRPILLDTSPLLTSFGEVLVEPIPEVYQGETVVTQFAGGHPRHNTMREGTFLIVEKCETNQTRCKTVATDADWSTKFHWKRPSSTSSESVIEVSWKIPENADDGFYRIRHFGYYKPATDLETRPYQGVTRLFKVGGGSKNIHPDWSPEPTKPKNIRTVSQFWNALASLVKG